MIFRFYLLTILFIFWISKAFSQFTPKDKALKIYIVEAHTGFSLPAADLAQRFGYNAHVGVGLQRQIANKWNFGFQASFLFGNQVKENNVLDHLINSSGDIISERGFPAEYLFYQRGFSGFLQVGKLFPVLGPNPNSGIFLQAGLGFLQHKIKIETRATEPPQLAKPYLRGYDRSSAGFAYQQFIGYRYLSNRRRLNFFAGFEVCIASTQSMRSFDYDRMQKDDRQRLDMLYGVKVGWVLPLYRKIEKELFYFD